MKTECSDRVDWIPAGHALELIASRFAAAKKLDAISAREEAKAAIVGNLASGRLMACPAGCLTSMFEQGKGRPSDFSYVELDANGTGCPIPMDVEREGKFVFVPTEFWEDFRDPASGASANWHDGHFSFRLVTQSRNTFAGEVRGLQLIRSSVEEIGASATLAADVARTGDPGAPEKGATLYLRELAARIHKGELEAGLSAQARVLHSWFGEKYPNQQSPTARTIENRIREMYWKAKNPTK